MRIVERLELYFVDLIKGKKRGLIAFFLRVFLAVISLFYAIIVNLRNWAYDRFWIRQYVPPIPVVVSVGNIVTGGTGKTPFTLMLANEFYEKTTVGIISRGYRSFAEKFPVPVVVCAGKGPLHSAAYCGDEPYLMAKRLPKSYIYVGKNRHQSVISAAKVGVQLAILEDGMQHRALARDYDIVVMDSIDPFGQNHYFPRGFLREGPKSLNRAHLVVINHTFSKEIFDAVCQSVHKYTKAPIIGTKLEVAQVCNFHGEPIETLTGKKAALFSGIGQPQRFTEAVKQCGVLQVVGQEVYPDHTLYYADQMVKLAEKYKLLGADCLICTEKDWVKIPDIPHLPLPIFWVKVEMKVVENVEAWDKFVSELKRHLEGA